MGTLCKINPNIRRARSRRASLVREIAGLSVDPRYSPTHQLAFRAIANELDRVRRAPDGDAARKEHRFQVIVKRHSLQSPV